MNQIFGIRIHFALFLTIIIGIFLRILAMRGDLWLDEIWTLESVKNLPNYTSIFTQLTTDNNHLLNSITLFYLGPHRNPLCYRMLPLLFSIGSFGLLWKVLDCQWLVKKSPEIAAITYIFFACSYLIVLYSTEARGYSGLIFSVLGATAFSKPQEEYCIPRAALFLTFVLIGITSHYSFTICFGGLALFHGMKSLISKRLKDISQYVFQYILPTLTILFLIKFGFSRLAFGGGGVHSKWDVIFSTSSLILGGSELSPYSPELALFGFLLGIIYFVISILEINELRKDNVEGWSLYLLVIFILPMLALLIEKPDFVYPRYFLVSIVFSYILISQFISRGFKENHGRKIFPVSLLTLFIIGQTVHFYDLFWFGRGQYSQAIEYILQHAQGKVEISSNHDFRNNMVVSYVKEEIFQGERLEYINTDNCPTKHVDWYIFQYQSAGFIAPATISACNQSFVRKEIFRSAELSGLNWVLYQKQDI